MAICRERYEKPSTNCQRLRSFVDFICNVLGETTKNSTFCRAWSTTWCPAINIEIISQQVNRKLNSRTDWFVVFDGNALSASYIVNTPVLNIFLMRNCMRILMFTLKPKCMWFAIFGLLDPRDRHTFMRVCVRTWCD